jgi:hypothetical protein
MRARGLRRLRKRDRRGNDSDEGDYFGSGIPSLGMSVQQPVIVLVARRNRVTREALEFAKSLSADVHAIHVTRSRPATDHLREAWDTWVNDIPLVILPAQGRSVALPVIQFIDSIQGDAEAVTLVLAQRIRTAPWWLRLSLSTSFFIRLSLKSRHNIIVCTVRSAELP